MVKGTITRLISTLPPFTKSDPTIFLIARLVRALSDFKKAGRNLLLKFLALIFLGFRPKLRLLSPIHAVETGYDRSVKFFYLSGNAEEYCAGLFTRIVAIPISVPKHSNTPATTFNSVKYITRVFKCLQMPVIQEHGKVCFGCNSLSDNE